MGLFRRKSKKIKEPVLGPAQVIAASTDDHAAALQSEPHIQVIGGDMGDIPPEQLEQIEHILGTDIHDDGTIDAEPASADAAEDRLNRLERLARLHESGALTDDEFAAEKRRVLDS